MHVLLALRHWVFSKQRALWRLDDSFSIHFQAPLSRILQHPKSGNTSRMIVKLPGSTLLTLSLYLGKPEKLWENSSHQICILISFIISILMGIRWNCCSQLCLDTLTFFLHCLQPEVFWRSVFARFPDVDNSILTCIDWHTRHTFQTIICIPIYIHCIDSIQRPILPHASLSYILRLESSAVNAVINWKHEEDARQENDCLNGNWANNDMSFWKLCTPSFMMASLWSFHLRNFRSLGPGEKFQATETKRKNKNTKSEERVVTVKQHSHKEGSKQTDTSQDHTRLGHRDDNPRQKCPQRLSQIDLCYSSFIFKVPLKNTSCKFRDHTACQVFCVITVLQSPSPTWSDPLRLLSQILPAILSESPKTFQLSSNEASLQAAESTLHNTQQLALSNRGILGVHSPVQRDGHTLVLGEKIVSLVLLRPRSTSIGPPEAENLLQNCGILSCSFYHQHESVRNTSCYIIY